VNEAERETLHKSLPKQHTAKNIKKIIQLPKSDYFTETPLLLMDKNFEL